MKTSFAKRMLSFLLVICLVIPMAPQITLPARAETQEQASANDPVIVVAGSDFQASNHELSAANVTALLNSVKTNGGYSNVDGFLFAGDYSNGWDTGYANPGITALKDAVNGVYPGLADSDGAVYLQGNHDPANTEDLSPSGANDTQEYGVFVINEDDFRWNNESTAENVKLTVSRLRAYLNSKISRGYTKPIFVVTHVPLHFTMRTVQNGDSMYGNLLVDVLNEAGAAGLNIIVLYGHNHSASWEDSHGGAAVYYQPGDTINVAQSSRTVCAATKIKFTYMNAGYVGYYTSPNSRVDTTLTVSVFEITEDKVTIARYSTDGVHNLKSAGVPNTGYTTHTESDYFQPNEMIRTAPRDRKLNKTIDTDSVEGVIVEADGVTDVDVIYATSQCPDGFTYYQSYDINPVGYTQGTTATVSVPIEAGFDCDRSAFIIDHERRKTFPAQIIDDCVTFTTDHFSMYTVAQMEETVVQSDRAGNLGGMVETVLTGEGTQEGIPYIITDNSPGSSTMWMLTGTAATKTGVGPGLLIEEDLDPDTSHVWYVDADQYLRYGSPTGKYVIINDKNVTLSDNLDTAAGCHQCQYRGRCIYAQCDRSGGCVELSKHRCGDGGRERSGQSGFCRPDICPRNPGEGQRQQGYTEHLCRDPDHG